MTILYVKCNLSKYFWRATNEASGIYLQALWMAMDSQEGSGEAVSRVSDKTLEQGKGKEKMNQLAKIEVARQALAEAKEIKDVKTILDKAEAVRHFLKQQNCTIEIQNYANVFCIEAQIKLGEMLKEMPKNEGGRPEITPTKKEGVIQGDTPTYEDLNITYKDASRCQQMAENKKEITVEIERRQSETIQTPIIATRLVNTVLKELQRVERKDNKLMPLPKNKYRTIVIDPPWPIEKILREDRPNQAIIDYPTMTIEEIKSFPINDIAYQDGCHIYLWTTHKFLPVAFEIFEQWGVKYQCLLTWVKNVGMTPFSFMYSTEHILFGRIGSLELLKNGERLDFSAKASGHSIKPDAFYELVKKVSPEPRIDVFNRRIIGGFDRYGNEL